MNRLFLAIRAQLHDYSSLQSDFLGSTKGRWVASENLHLTMCYFGDTYSIDDLLKILSVVVEEVEPLTLTSLGYFEHNKILYAKVKSKKLERLQSSISSLFSLPNEKLFIPHVTLMRIKDIHNKNAFKQILENYKDKTIGRLDTRLELINSHLSPDGVEYESVKRFES